MPLTPIADGEFFTAESINSRLREIEVEVEKLYNVTDENGNIVLAGEYNKGWLQIGTWRLWVDDRGKLRAMNRTPANHEDGFDMVEDLAPRAAAGAEGERTGEEDAEPPLPPPPQELEPPNAV